MTYTENKSLGEIFQKYPHAVTSNGSCPLDHHQKNHRAIDHHFTNQNTLPQVINSLFNRRTHQAADLHTVAPCLRTVFFITNCRQSTVLPDSLHCRHLFQKPMTHITKKPWRMIKQSKWVINYSIQYYSILILIQV